MIILDMDGTLLNSDKVILESSKKILRQLKKMGKTIVIATGRCLGTATPYLSEEFVDYAITNHGSVWYRLSDNKIILKNCLNNQRCIEVLNEYHDDISRVDIMNLNLYKFNSVDEAIEYLKDNEVIHINIHLKDYKKSRNLVEKIKEEYKDFHTFLMQDSFSEKQWIDILCKDNNKGISIKKLIEYLDVDFNDTICFGDAYNDVEMFKSVKTSVAMGNALPEVKAIATYVTDSHDEDGIYNFLDNYFLKK